MLPPIVLTPQKQELCNRLDALNKSTIQGQELSKMFIGAIYAIREESRGNPDWMAQSAHSLREILYQFKSKRSKLRWVDAFNIFGSVTAKDKKFKEIIGRVYNRIAEVAHHQLDLSIDEYDKLIDEYERVLLWALDRQIDVHNQIDEFLSRRKSEELL
jgi:hypothetical protein